MYTKISLTKASWFFNRKNLILILPYTKSRFTITYTFFVQKLSLTKPNWRSDLLFLVNENRSAFTFYFVSAFFRLPADSSSHSPGGLFILERRIYLKCARMAAFASVGNILRRMAGAIWYKKIRRIGVSVGLFRGNGGENHLHSVAISV